MVLGGCLWEHLGAVTFTPMTTAALATEVLEHNLPQRQVTTSLTVLALNAFRNPEQSPRVTALLGDLLADIQVCEEQLRTYGVC